MKLYSKQIPFRLELFILLLFSVFFSGILSASAEEYEFMRKTGSYGTGNGQFYKPESVKTDIQGNVYVVDTDNHRIQKFNAQGNFLLKWGRNGGDGSSGSGDGEFDKPHDIAINTLLGLAFVADTGNNRIQVFDLNGNFINAIYGAGPHPDTADPFTRMWRPYAVATNSAYGWLYIAGWFQRDDGYWPGIQVYKTDGVTTSLINFKALDVMDSGNRLHARGLAVDFQSRLFVANAAANKIEVRYEDGSSINTFGTLGSGDGQFIFPTGIDVDDYAQIYVADKSNHRIQIFKFDGTFVTKIGVPGKLDGQFSSPAGVAVDPLGRVFVADTAYHRMQAFRTGSINFSGNDSQYTSKRLIKVAIINRHADQYRVKNYGDAAYSDWQEVQSDFTWDLGAGDGIKKVLVQVADTYGNFESKPYTASIKLDSTAPRLTSITSPELSSYESTAGHKFTVQWKATDLASGVESYDVQVKTNGGTWQNLSGFVGTTKLSAKYTGTAGNTHYFRFRAKDKAGKVSSWSPATKTVVPVDDKLLSYTAGWSTSSGVYDDYYQATAKMSKQANAYASYTFQGKGVYLLGSVASYAGIAKIYINGSLVSTVDLYAPATKHNRVIFSKSFVENDTRTIKVVVTGTKSSNSSGTWVDIDGIGVLK